MAEHNYAGSCAASLLVRRYLIILKKEARQL
jgi:hypothetical protein